MVSEIKFKMHSDPFIVDIDDMREITVYYGGTVSDKFKKANEASLITNKDLSAT
jgi:hypothetical protein